MAKHGLTKSGVALPCAVAGGARDEHDHFNQTAGDSGETSLVSGAS